MTTETQANAPVDQNNTTTTSATDTTTGGEQELSLREELSAGLEIQEKGTDKPDDLSAAARRLAGARKSKAAEAGKPADVGKPEDTTVKADDVKVDVKKTEDTAAAPAEAPAHWPAADREMFAKQPPEVKNWLLNRHKAMEADYTRKTQDLAGTRRLKETMDEVFAPFREQMQLSGVDDAMAIRQLVAAHTKLQNDPAGGLKFLAEKYGIDLKKLTEGAAAADPAGESPTVIELRKQVSTLTGQIKTLTGAQDQQQHNARINEVQQFAEEKDAQGNPKRPYFDEVSKDIVRLINGARAVGEQISLQDAYDAAVRANPTTHAKWLAARDAERKAKEESERKQKAEDAKRAGFDVKGEGAAATVAASTNSLRADLEAAWSGSEGRV